MEHQTTPLVLAGIHARLIWVYEVLQYKYRKNIILDGKKYATKFVIPSMFSFERKDQLVRIMNLLTLVADKYCEYSFFIVDSICISTMMPIQMFHLISDIICKPECHCFSQLHLQSHFHTMSVFFAVFKVQTAVT